MLEEAKEVLKNFVEAIPPVLLGPERVNFITDNINRVPNNEKMLLHKLANDILSNMVERNASDIELGGFGTDGFIWFRIFGKKERARDLVQLTSDEASALIVSLLTPNQCRHLLVSRNLDFSYSFRQESDGQILRFRANAYFDLDTLGLNMRSISSTIRSLDTLCFHPNAVKMMSHTYIKFGLSLITGITGSGKSSTLDSIIDYHNRKEATHIVIIASPIEYIHKSSMSIVRHREVGRDALTFKEGVMQSLRQDPDIIVIGEMRDPETIMAALEVTDTGHKVFSTLHTSSAVESIDRIIGEVNPVEQERVRNRLADTLVSIVSQKLVPSLDGKRMLAKEILLMSPSVKAAIKNNNTSEIYMMINQGGNQGMMTMEQDLLRLYKERKISKDTAVNHSNNKTRMLQLLMAA